MPTAIAAPAAILAPADILTVNELAARLKVKPTWVYEQMRRKTDNPLPVFKMGRYLRFSWSDVSAWLQSKRPARARNIRGK